MSSSLIPVLIAGLVLGLASIAGLVRARRVVERRSSRTPLRPSHARP